mmetsp:Transcript_22587/g.62873  ORF Transcript_22587/g.62873 Transcript_22587/m.62873 type:complete len:82 (-) Transcript_22587:410-655(-)
MYFLVSERCEERKSTGSGHVGHILMEKAIEDGNGREDRLRQTHWLLQNAKVLQELFEVFEVFALLLSSLKTLVWKVGTQKR